MTVEIIVPSVKVVDLTQFNRPDVSATELLSEYVGRSCYNSYDKLTPDSYLKFNAHGAKKSHRSIFEFNNMRLVIHNLTYDESSRLYETLDNCKFLEYEIVETSLNVWSVIIYGSTRSFIEVMENCVGGNFSNVVDIRLFNAIYKMVMGNSSNIFKHWSTFNEINNYRCEFNSGYEYESTYSDVTTLVKGKTKFKKLLVEVVTDKGLHNEMVRHRPCSFMAESQRYVRYGIDNDNPFRVCVASCHVNDGQYIDEVKKSSEASFDSYLKLLKLGYTAQLSRAVLPVGTAMKYFIYATLEEYNHIFNLRTSRTALPMAQEVTKEIRDQFVNKNLM